MTEYITKSGKMLTEEDIAMLVAEAERGYPVVSDEGTRIECIGCTVYAPAQAYTCATVDDMERHLMRHRKLACMPYLVAPSYLHAYALRRWALIQQLFDTLEITAIRAAIGATLLAGGDEIDHMPVQPALAREAIPEPPDPLDRDGAIELLWDQMLGNSNE